MMIVNDLQYQTTKQRLEGFQKTLIALNQPQNELRHKNPILWQSNLDALESFIEEFTELIEEYEKLIQSDQSEPIMFEISSIEALPTVLIKARIASGMTQEELAQRLGISEALMQRYEDWEYQAANLSQLLDVIEILGVSIKPKITLEMVNCI